MFNTVITFKGKRVINLISAILIILLVLPDDVYNFLPIYSSFSKSYIASNRLNFHMGLIVLIILIIGIAECIFHHNKLIFTVFLLMTIREVIFFFLTENNIFSNKAYEMYLVFFIGCAFAAIAYYENRSEIDIVRFFEFFLITNIISLYFNVIIKGFNISERYNASNLDVGGTGTLCVISLIYFLLKKDSIKLRKNILVLVSAIGLFLSGSRANLLFAVMILALYYLSRVFSKREVSQQHIINAIAAVALVIVSIFIASILFKSQISALFNSMRSFSNLLGGNISKDESVLGRTQSLLVGLKVLKKYPLGISGYFLNLQYNMQILGYPTFPHSTLLSMYILFGPIVFLTYYYWIKGLRITKQARSPFFWILLYLTIASIVYGAPFLNFKNIFINCFVTVIAIHYPFINNSNSDEYLSVVYE